MNRKIRAAIAYEYFKVLIPILALLWVSINSSMFILGSWGTLQIVLVIFGIIMLRLYNAQKNKKAELEDSLGSVIHNRSESVIFWDALTLAVSKAGVKRPELRKYKDDDETHGVCTWLGLGKYVVGLNEELESIPEDANVVAAHEVAHQAMKHSVFQMWVMVAMNIILTTNVVLLLNAATMALYGKVHFFAVIASVVLTVFVFFYSRMTHAVVDTMVEYTAWLKAIDLIGLNPIIDYLIKSAAMKVDIDVDSAGNKRQRISFSEHAITLARIDWLAPYYEDTSHESEESEG
jgi:Zn-dependent protease with chaperone function